MACLLPHARLSVSTKPLTRQMELLPHPGAFFFQQKRLTALAEPGRDRGGHPPPRYDHDNPSAVRPLTFGDDLALKGCMRPSKRRYRSRDPRHVVRDRDNGTHNTRQMSGI